MLRGNIAAKIDDKGRLKVPTAHRALIEEKYGLSLFVTSLTGRSVLIYPMPVWLEIEEKLAKAPSSLPARRRFTRQVNFFGQAAELDKQGRVLVHGRLREAALMQGEVDVFGQLDHLAVWNHERCLEWMEREPYSDEDAETLSGYGV